MTPPSDSSPGPGPTPPPGAQSAWERDLVTRLAFAALAEQRRARRWSTAFRFALLAYLVVVLVLYLPVRWIEGPTGDRHTALVELEGVITGQSDASADRVVAGLRAAFEDEDTAGVILRINSPGGSPVQAGYINDEIVRLRKAHPKVPLYAVISDICASGGYYVAVAADRIYADKASLVGSIGVILNGFGFVEAMEKLGIERRLLTAGEHKGLLDPFSPARAAEVRHVDAMLAQIHGQFIDVVKRGRGDRLSDDPAIFSGLIWSGEESKRLGLVDELASASQVAREVIGAEEIVDFTPRRGLLESVAERMGAAAASALATSLSLDRASLR